MATVAQKGKIDISPLITPKKQTERVKRYMLAVSEDDYNMVSALAKEHQTTRGRIVTALLDAIYGE